MFFKDLFNIKEKRDQEGNETRDKNHEKAKVLMALAANFADDSIIEEIQEIFNGLTPEQMENFKDYLNSRKYLKNNDNVEAQHIIHQIVEVATNSKPKDKHLAKIFEKYNKNLKLIQKLKIEAKDTSVLDGMKVYDLTKKIEELSDENVKLFEDLNQYRDLKNL